MCPCRGECGRGRVGEVLDVTIRLFLLLVRQLKTQKSYNHITSFTDELRNPDQQGPMQPGCCLALAASSEPHTPVQQL